MKNEYFETVRMGYVVACLHNVRDEANRCFAFMQGYRWAVSEYDFWGACKLHDRIISAIDFYERLRTMRDKKERNK